MINNKLFIELPKIQSEDKIALFFFGAIGDILVCTAAVSELTRAFPNNNFTIIGSKFWIDVLKPSRWPNIKNILIMDKKKFKNPMLFKCNLNTDTWQMEDTKINSFRDFLKPFKLTINLDSNSFYFATQTFLARNPYRFSIHKSRLSHLFFNRVYKLEKHDMLHERNRFLKILFTLKESLAVEREYFWQKNSLPTLKYLENRDTICKEEILINPTASVKEKAWKAENFRKLALNLKQVFESQNLNFKIKIVGQIKETEWLQEIAQNDFEIVQSPNLLNLYDTIAKAKLLICNTSALQFLASSTQTPCLTLMGAAYPERWGPLGENAHIIKACHDKRPKAKLFQSKEKIGKALEQKYYNQINVEDVYVKTLILLDIGHK